MKGDEDLLNIKEDHQRLLANLKLLQRIHGKAKLCEILDISPATWTNRMKEPWRLFCYDDFRLLAIFCNVNIGTLITGELKIQ